MLLLHAGVTDRRSWAPLVDHLGGRYRTIVFDRRGFGESCWEAAPHAVVDDVVAVLDPAGASEAIVVGASNGGRRALDLALAHPNRVRGLVLIGSGASGAPGVDESILPESARDLVAAYEAADAGDDLDHLNRIEAWAWLDGWTAREGRVAGEVRDLFLDMNGIALRADPVGDEVAPMPAWDRLGEIALPTLVLCGEFDAVSLPASHHIAATIPGARYELLPGTAHLPHLEGDRLTLELIAEHLDAIG